MNLITNNHICYRQCWKWWTRDIGNTCWSIARNSIKLQEDRQNRSCRMWCHQKPSQRVYHVIWWPFKFGSEINLHWQRPSLFVNGRQLWFHDWYDILLFCCFHCFILTEIKPTYRKTTTKETTESHQSLHQQIIQGPMCCAWSWSQRGHSVLDQIHCWVYQCRSLFGRIWRKSSKEDKQAQVKR